MGTISLNKLNQTSNALFALIVVVFVHPSKLLSQSLNDDQEAVHLDDHFILDSRSSSLGGASSVFVNDLSALYLNPSGLSSSVFSKSTASEGLVRELRFPRIGTAIGEGSTPLKYDFQMSGLSETPKDGGSIDRVLDGVQQYGRFSASPLSLLVGNVGVMFVMDEQVASYSSLEPQGGVEFDYRSFTGVIVGSSFDLEPFTVGISRTIGNMESIRTQVPTDVAADVDDRRQYLKQRLDKSKFDRYQVGFSRNFIPSLNLRGSVVLREHDFNRKENEGVWLAGLGIAPYLGSRVRLATSLEMHSINKPQIPVTNKPRAGVELDLLNGQGNLALCSIRSGYSSAGFSYGAGINIGLIKVEVTSEVKNVGTASETSVQRRTNATLSIDVASPL